MTYSAPAARAKASTGAFGMGDATPAVASLPEASDGSAGHGLSKFSCGRSATAAVRHDGHLFTVGHTQNSGALERAE